jgi:hypothetical protein
MVTMAAEGSQGGGWPPGRMSKPPDNFLRCLRQTAKRLLPRKPIGYPCARRWAFSLRVAAAFFADADLLALDREADAAPPFLPPLCAAGWPVLFPRPEPPGFFPPASSLLTVAHARRSASFSGTPRSS